MFKNVAMEHVYTLMLKLDCYFYCLIWMNGNAVLPAPFIFRWFFSISGKYFKLGPVYVEWMNHATHHVWFIINFPHFGNPLLLREINSDRKSTRLTSSHVAISYAV